MIQAIVHGIQVPLVLLLKGYVAMRDGTHGTTYTCGSCGELELHCYCEMDRVIEAS